MPGAGADRTMGLFINTLPVRLDLDGTGVEQSVRATHARLSELLSHEHASLALAQRCSGVAAPAPLFGALLNYRHNTPAAGSTTDEGLSGIEWLGGEERTNYPLTLAVEDFGAALGLTAQVVEPICRGPGLRLHAAGARAAGGRIGAGARHAGARARHPAGRRAGLSARGAEPDGSGLSVGSVRARAVRGAGANGRPTRWRWSTRTSV
ncbi:hypothetical protein ACFSSN_22545 [Sinorhizobium terangae]|uniref:hypothetical protein n=1 Tax=Sinorhizobium terangae TaxID=110322 RepID=UPI00363A0BD5